MAKSATEKSAFTEQLMEEVCDRENLERAWKRNGGTGTTDSRSFAASASRSSPHRSLPVHRRGSGACPDTRRFNTLYKITCSTLLAAPESSCLCRLNSIEPPWYGPVCPVVWEGWRRETSPYPDQAALCRVRHRQVLTNDARIAQLSAPPSLPLNNELRLPMAIGRMQRSTVLLSTSTRPSLRNNVNLSQ